jgi:HlyD family secretion protein
VDIARPDIAKKKRRRRIFALAFGLVAVAAVSIGLSRLDPALPTVDSPVFTDTVKRGPMLREVRGSGTLVPEEVFWVTALSPGHIENILLLPGVTVTADTVLFELSNPEVEQAAFDAEAQVEAAEAQADKLKVQLESDRLTLEATVASLKSDLAQAAIEAEADEALRKEGLVPGLTAKHSRAKADELKLRYEIEQKRLVISDKSAAAQIKAQQAEVSKFRKQHLLKVRQVEALKVRAGVSGVLQRLGDDRPLQVGQQVLAGASIARIANQEKLKAEIRVAESQARDIQANQIAEIDTRNGVVIGHVVRVDPAVQNGTVTVDIQPDAPLPRGARPDLSVDGTITLEKLENALYVGRPANAQPETLVTLFKLADAGKTAVRTRVRFGRSSVSNIEILEGLQVGDQIILSGMEQWDSHERVRLK